MAFYEELFEITRDEREFLMSAPVIRDALAGRITRNAPLAVRESLRVARSAGFLDEVELVESSRLAREAVARSDDFREGPRAFIEKREPRWTGR